MQESKDHRWFQKKINEEKRLNAKYGDINKWQVAPNTFANTHLSKEELAEARDALAMQKMSSKRMNSNDSKGGDKSGVSLGRINSSPSGAVLSDGRWKSPPKNIRQSTSPGIAPFNKKSLGRLSLGSRNSLTNTISVQDQKYLQEHNQLTIERVEAMKLMTNKMSKVAKVPIVMENKFCSHMDPATSANLIAAQDLAPHNKNFFNMWRDKEVRSKSRHDLPKVPQHYYSNYKTNMVRDAHFMAKRIVDKHAQGIVHLEGCAAATDETGKISCNCKEKEKKMVERKRFRSYIGGVKSRAKSKNVIKNAYNLYKPFRPCRRTCCSTHNPMFHAQRMQHEHLQRMHASATKLMIMKVVPERPYSADSATKAFQAYVRDIDFHGSMVHGEAKHRRATLVARKSIRQRSLEGIQGIAERGEGEEADRGFGGSNHGLSHLGLGESMKSNKMTASNLNLLKKELEGTSTLDDQRAYSQLECNYLVSILKNRSVQAVSIKDHMFEKIYAKARTTLKLQMKKLLLKKQFYVIDNQYKLAENEKQTSENLIKILSRCLKMYDAQNELYKIIMLIEERLESLNELKKEQRKEAPESIKFRKLYQEIVKFSVRILGQIRVLKDIEKCMNRPFMFNGVMYDGDHMFR